MTAPHAKASLPGLLERLLNGEAAALARAISLLDAGPAVGRQILREVYPRAGSAAVIGFTGPPGAGKSTLISAYVAWLRSNARRVAVVAVDPSSPLSGGAVLGDRVRMGRHSHDPQVFIRSIAARGHLGGLSANIHDVVTLIDAAGFDDVILETVGAGQSEIEVTTVADVKVVISAPHLGDDIQALKAGILEIADVLVVNKADLPDADRTVSQLAAMLQLRAEEARDVPLVRTVATEDDGIDELADAISERLARADRSEPAARAEQRMRAVIVAAAQRYAHALLTGARASTVDDFARAVLRGELDPPSAGIEALRAALDEAGGHNRALVADD